MDLIKLVVGRLTQKLEYFSLNLISCFFLSLYLQAPNGDYYGGYYFSITLATTIQLYSTTTTTVCKRCTPTINKVVPVYHPYDRFYGGTHIKDSVVRIRNQVVYFYFQFTRDRISHHLNRISFFEIPENKCFFTANELLYLLYIHCSYESMNTVRLIKVYNILLTDATVQFLQRAMEFQSALCFWHTRGPPCVKARTPSVHTATATIQQNTNHVAKKRSELLYKY